MKPRITLPDVSAKLAGLLREFDAMELDAVYADLAALKIDIDDSIKPGAPAPYTPSPPAPPIDMGKRGGKSKGGDLRLVRADLDGFLRLPQDATITITIPGQP